MRFLLYSTNLVRPHAELMPIIPWLMAVMNTFDGRPLCELLGYQASELEIIGWKATGLWYYTIMTAGGGDTLLVFHLESHGSRESISETFGLEQDSYLLLSGVPGTAFTIRLPS